MPKSQNWLNRIQTLLVGKTFHIYLCQLCTVFWIFAWSKVYLVFQAHMFTRSLGLRKQCTVYLYHYGMLNASLKNYLIPLTKKSVIHTKLSFKINFSSTSIPQNKVSNQSTLYSIKSKTDIFCYLKGLGKGLLVFMCF